MQAIAKNLLSVALGYAACLALLAVVGTLSTSSRLPLWRRILTLEDAGCAYGICFVLAGLLYGAFRLGALVVRMLRGRGGPRP